VGFANFDLGLTSGATYFLSFDYSKIGGTNIRVRNTLNDGGSNVLLQAVGTSGTYSGSFTASGSAISLAADTTLFNGTLDNFLLYQTGTLASSLAASPMLSGLAQAGASVTVTDTVSGVATVLGTVRADSAGIWRLQASSITSGSHTITATQTDLAGNTSSASSGYTFTVDATQMGLPALASASDSGTVGDAITNRTAPTLTGVARTANGSVQVFDGSTLLGTATADANGVWTFTPTASLAPGLHRISAKDVTTNTTSGVLNLTVDTDAAAAPSIATPVASNVQRAPTLSGTGVEANATITLSARATDGSASQSFTATANASGVWAIDTANPPNAQTALAANKVWVFSATQTDAAGNTSAVSTSQTVNYDTSIATPLTISNLADNASTNRQVTLSGTAEASNALGNVTVKVYDGSTVLGTTTTDFMGGWTFTTPALSAGAHTLKVEQVDAAGNLSAQLSKPITVDTTALGAPVLGGYDGLQISTAIGGNNRLTATAIPLSAADGSAVSFWAKLDSLGNQQLLSSGMGNYDLWIQNGQLVIWNGVSNDLSAVFTIDTSWHQYTIVQDGTGVARLFIDGTPIASPGGSNTTFTSATLHFGNNANPGWSLNGSMRDIKVWDVTLTTAQVQALYQGQPTGQESQIKAAYALLGDTTATTGPALTVTGTMTGVVSVNGRVADTGILGDNITSGTIPVLRGQAAANATLEVWDTVSGVSSFVQTRGGRRHRCLEHHIEQPNRRRAQLPGAPAQCRRHHHRLGGHHPHHRHHRPQCAQRSGAWPWPRTRAPPVTTSPASTRPPSPARSPPTPGSRCCKGATQWARCRLAPMGHGVSPCPAPWPMAATASPSSKKTPLAT
jgi:hypothetical protein